MLDGAKNPEYAGRMEPNPAPKKWRFPLMRLLLRIYRGWRLRHQDARNFLLHLVGIPLAVAGFVELISSRWHSLPWYWGVGGFVVGYFLQWVGHRIEGNDVGELIPIKRLLGLPTVSIAPQYQQKSV